MNLETFTLDAAHRLGEVATHPIARLAGRLAALRLLTGGYPFAAVRPRRSPSSRPFDGAEGRLAIRPANRTLGHVQLPLLGL